MAPAKHWIANPQAEVLAGIAALIAGALLLRDAYEGRGREQPKVLRPFSFW